ncbi:MAG: metallophosphoesterase, partial [Candidatus Omnitrophica bacterium CG1_02_49_10]
RVLRPANYPDGSPGSGFCVFRSNKSRIGVINIVGRVFMNTLLCPFDVSKKCVNEIKEKADIIIVDVHAEATSEKVALGWFLDGKVSAVIGTHTHIQTADEKILPKGTAYITDAGMTGPYDSVIGRRKECVLERFITQLPVKFEMAEGDVMLCGVVIDIDEKSGKARSIERVQHKGSA